MNDRTLVLAGIRFCRRMLLLGILAAATTAGSCSSETLFQSNFDTALDQPPSSTQAVGTAEITGAPGSVLVAAAPPDAAPPAKWLRIFRPNDPSQISVFRGKLFRQAGVGTYVFSSAVVIPDGNTGPVSIQFEDGAGDGFLHLDFMPAGNVRLDDDANVTFGTYPHKQVFLVQVTLDIRSDNTSKAHIILSGAGASGETDRTFISPFQMRAMQFGAVRLFIGFPNLGTFHANNVVVTKKA
jgi:hypothetical protein